MLGVGLLMARFLLMRKQDVLAARWNWFDDEFRFCAFTAQKNGERISGFPVRARLSTELKSLRALGVPGPFVLAKPNARSDQTFLPSEICRFARALTAAGKKVNGNALRQMNGGQGSPKSLMKAWLSGELETYEAYDIASFTTAVRRVIPQALRRPNSQWLGEGEDGLGERLRRGERTFHGLRVTGAVELALAGFNDAEIQAALGDRSPMMAWRYRKMAQRERLLEGINRLPDGWPAGMSKAEAGGVKEFILDRLRFGFISRDDLLEDHAGDVAA